MSKRIVAVKSGFGGKVLTQHDLDSRKAMEPMNPDTNITPAMIANVKFMLEHEHKEGSFGLLSCTCDGRKTAAIVAIEHHEDKSVSIMPLAIMVTPDMELLDPDGKPAVLAGTAEA